MDLMLQVQHKGGIEIEINKCKNVKIEKYKCQIWSLQV